MYGTAGQSRHGRRREGRQVIEEHALWRFDGYLGHRIASGGRACGRCQGAGECTHGAVGPDVLSRGQVPHVGVSGEMSGG